MKNWKAELTEKSIEEQGIIAIALKSNIVKKIDNLNRDILRMDVEGEVLKQIQNDYVTPYRKILSDLDGIKTKSSDLF